MLRVLFLPYHCCMANDSLVFAQSRGSQVRNLLLGALLLAMAVGLAYMNYAVWEMPNRWMNYGWLLLAIAGIGTIVRNVKPPPAAKLSPAGLKARALGNATIKWSYIQGFEAKALRDETIIVVRTRNNGKLLKEMNHAVRALLKSNEKSYGVPVVLPAALFTQAPEAVCEAMESYRNKRKS